MSRLRRRQSDLPIISRRLALIGWQKLLYKLQEFPWPVRFSNVCVATNRSGFLIVTAEGEGCDSNYRDMTEVLPRFDPTARFRKKITEGELPRWENPNELGISLHAD